jgi:hypothetical protein
MKERVTQGKIKIIGKLNNASIEDVLQKGTHVPSMERTTLKNKVSQNKGECISRIPSESNVAC